MLGVPKDRLPLPLPTAPGTGVLCPKAGAGAPGKQRAAVSRGRHGRKSPAFGSRGTDPPASGCRSVVTGGLAGLVQRQTKDKLGRGTEASRAEELTKGLISCCLSHQAKRGGMAHPCDPRDLWGARRLRSRRSLQRWLGIKPRRPRRRTPSCPLRRRHAAQPRRWHATSHARSQPMARHRLSPTSPKGFQKSALETLFGRRSRARTPPDGRGDGPEPPPPKGRLSVTVALWPCRTRPRERGVNGSAEPFLRARLLQTASLDGNARPAIPAAGMNSPWLQLRAAVSVTVLGALAGDWNLRRGSTPHPQTQTGDQARNQERIQPHRTLL